MSLEDCIKDHAAAIRELAAAILGTTSAARVTGMLPVMSAAYGKAELTDAQIDAEIDAAVTQVEADAKPNATRAVIEQKLAEARAAKNASSAAGTATPAADTQTTAGAADTATDSAQTSYDYQKDVQPLLVKVGKNRDQLVALLKRFGAAKGGDIKPSFYADVIAAANKLLGG